MAGTGPAPSAEPSPAPGAQVFLALHLLYEATNATSTWHRYIRALPQSYSSLLFFSDEVRRRPPHVARETPRGR